MTHFIIFALVLYVLFRAAIRPRKTDPMAGRLVPRGYALDMEEWARFRAYAMRDTEARLQREWDARLAHEDYLGAMYKYDCAKRAWHAGYGPRPTYRPKET